MMRILVVYGVTQDDVIDAPDVAADPHWEILA